LPILPDFDGVFELKRLVWKYFEQMSKKKLLTIAVLGCTFIKHGFSSAPLMFCSLAYSFQAQKGKALDMEDAGDEPAKSRLALPPRIAVFLNVMTGFFLIRKPTGLSGGLMSPSGGNNELRTMPALRSPQGEVGNYELKWLMPLHKN
jgi:hypothetical protein